MLIFLVAVIAVIMLVFMAVRQPWWATILVLGIAALIAFPWQTVAVVATVLVILFVLVVIAGIYVSIADFLAREWAYKWRVIRRSCLGLLSALLVLCGSLLFFSGIAEKLFVGFFNVPFILTGAACLAAGWWMESRYAELLREDAALSNGNSPAVEGLGDSKNDRRA